METFAYIILIILAIFAVQTQKLRISIILMGVFSLIMSFVYLLFGAPDVALAEAVIGSTLSTILYLVALQKYKLFTIYYKIHEEEIIDLHHFTLQNESIVKLVEVFCAKNELEPQVIYSVERIGEILRHQYALIIDINDHEVVIYGHPENYKLDALVIYLDTNLPSDYSYRLIEVNEVIF